VSNPNDQIRDGVLRKLYDVHRTARGPKKVAIGIRDLCSAMKQQHGYKQNDVVSNLDYLAQKKWVTRVVEQRTFATPKGTVQPEPRVTYKISDIGIDRLEAASTYQRTDTSARINVTNISGVTVVGDGNVVNAQFTELSRVLNDTRQAVLSSSSLNEDAKLDVVSDIDSQLQKATPNRGLIKSIWSGIQNVLTAAEFAEFIGKAATLIGPLMS
jgi:hypothetical protein